MGPFLHNKLTESVTEGLILQKKKQLGGTTYASVGITFVSQDELWD